MKKPRDLQLDLSKARVLTTVVPGIAPAALPVEGKAARLKNTKGGNSRKLPEDCLLLPGEPGGRYEVTIPGWHPTRLNVLINSHHCAASRMKKSDAIAMGRALRSAGVPRATGKRRVGLVIVLGPRMRAADPDAYHKSVNDGLKHVGAVVDDSRKWVEMDVDRYSRAAAKATRIILEDVP